VGPELTHVASNRGVAYMVEAILAPSYVIVPGFEPYVILTGDGEYVGIKKAEDDRSIALMLIDGNMETIQKNDIRSIARRETSVMPDNFSKVLTIEEFHNILSFLRTLR
jgi:putative heme-binding domain-containing protein